GAFPLWLSPEQIRILPVSEKTEEYARKVEQRFREAGFRVSTDCKSGKVQAKIRDAQLELIPYMVVVGPRESERNAVALRDRIEGDLGSMPIENAIDKLKQEVTDRVVRQVFQSEFEGLEGESPEQHEY
ncbi:MAG: threonine--tRNA ligase, partial [Planctomycetes bacterium]|nr:threonine--tRNA ligase [Planctomycetota bacterium]